MPCNNVTLRTSENLGQLSGIPRQGGKSKTPSKQEPQTFICEVFSVLSLLNRKSGTYRPRAIMYTGPQEKVMNKRFSYQSKKIKGAGPLSNHPGGTTLLLWVKYATNKGQVQN